MTKRTRMRAAAALLAAGAVVLTGCGPGSGGGGEPIEADSLDELVEAAEAEGQLVWYQTADERIGQRLSEAFGEKYDIQVSFNRLNSSQMEQRFSAEMEADAPAADLIIPINSDFMVQAMDNGWLVSLQDAGLPEYPLPHMPEQTTLTDQGTSVIGITQYAFGYNEDEVSASEVPTTWEDLLDEKWDGKMLMSDPTISTVYTDMYYLVEQEYGIEYLEKLGAKEPRIYQGAAPMGEALAAGEGDLAIPLPVEFMANLRDEGGAPLAWEMPDVSVGAASVIGVVEGAAHPNAARLFANWLMSEEGLEVFTSSEGTVNPVNTDEWPTDISGPALGERAQERQADIFEALGF